ncbi:MAG: hypothetical protein DMF55_09575 [Acidobacteria bacterium]|nr:MAG: hypothetical protein DMF55_09575 [Acidobacteriota bacterium]
MSFSEADSSVEKVPPPGAGEPWNTDPEIVSALAQGRRPARANEPRTAISDHLIRGILVSRPMILLSQGSTISVTSRLSGRNFCPTAPII